MFEFDICLCVPMYGRTCEKYTECFRGCSKRPEGIYTMSDFTPVCNKGNNY